MNVIDARKGQRQPKRRVLEESTKEKTKRGSNGPGTKHLLHVHQECTSDRDDSDKEIRGPVIPFVKTLALEVEVPRIRSNHVSIQRKVTDTRQL